MKRRLGLVPSLAWLAAICLVGMPLPLGAHHAFSAEFDAEAPILLRGHITKIEWVNPHTWIHVDAIYEDSDTLTWMVEGGTPNTLLRRGLTRDTLLPGTEIIVRGYQSKDRVCNPVCMANGRDITFLDGTKLFLGSSGTGAPRDGADPREGSGANTLIDDSRLPTTSTLPYEP
jgi:hypothetical protein